MPTDKPSFKSCLEKQSKLIIFFSICKNKEEIYSKIIELGRKIPPMNKIHCKDEFLVKGCQSLMYLRSWVENGKLYYEASSDALISAGLAALMMQAYSGESPQDILLCPPKFLDEIGITGSLSLNRSNGLTSLHIKMKQEALKAKMLMDKESA